MLTNLLVVYEYFLFQLFILELLYIFIIFIGDNKLNYIFSLLYIKIELKKIKKTNVYHEQI